MRSPRGVAGQTKPLDAHWRQVAVKAASHVRFGVHAAPPVAFPVQLTGLPASWRLISGVRAWMPEWNPLVTPLPRSAP
jgi:hypothetical protein